MRVPASTYRLQITDRFTLEHARDVVSYLAGLGISDIYLSPIFEARTGSAHGYDVTDPTRIRSSVGGIAALRSLAAETQRHDMGILLDIVPNHMAASVENPWWRDVLLHGRDSMYAHFFDIDWGTTAEPRRLQLPILGDQLPALIARGEITIDDDAGEIVYHETRLPIAPGTAVSHDAASHAAGDDDSDRVRRGLDAQHYQLVFWRDASHTMSYRRFFDITDLAGVRVEDDDVFQAAHSLIRTLAADGTITGLRIDHIDGLRDPAGYLDRLREHVRGPDGGPVYTVVEKILERDEQLPPDWACEGTTGYEFLSIANGLLIDPDGHRSIVALYHRVTADTRAFDELVLEKKLLVIERLFGSELAALGSMLTRLTSISDDVASRVIAELSASLGVYRTYIRDDEVGSTDRKRIEDAAAAAIEREPELADAVTTLRKLLLETDSVPADRRVERLDFVMRWQQFTGPVTAKGFEDTALYCHNALIAANDVGTDPARPVLSQHELHDALAGRAASLPLALSTTATHDTKRGEDTRARLAVLSEMAGQWRTGFRRWAREGDEWRAELADDETEEPGADVDSLLYQTLIGTWPIDASDPSFLERIQAYMTKAVREAKDHTSWRRPDEDFEEALDAFIARLMADVGRTGLIEEVAALAELAAPHGALNSMTQMLLRMTAPGIPDTYQGTELWSLTLVDPDNRQPVDFDERRRHLAELEPILATPDAAAVAAVMRDWTDGRIKLLLTAAALRFRARYRQVFTEGAYVPLHADGPKAAHVFAFARVHDDDACITVLPRWTTRLSETGALPVDPAVWEGTTLAIPDTLSRPWQNVLTGESLPADEALQLTQLFATIPYCLAETQRRRAS